jgi:hypothetical protein
MDNTLEYVLQRAVADIMKVGKRRFARVINTDRET